MTHIPPEMTHIWIHIYLYDLTHMRWQWIVGHPYMTCQSIYHETCLPLPPPHMGWGGNDYACLVLYVLCCMYCHVGWQWVAYGVAMGSHDIINPYTTRHDSWYMGCHMGWQWAVSALNSQVSFAKELEKNRALLHKRSENWGSLQMVATPYHIVDCKHKIIVSSQAQDYCGFIMYVGS